jgi:hypothetical protein
VATDAAGRVSAEKSRQFAIDRTAPTTTAATDDQGSATTLTLTATDGGSGVATVQYQVAGGFTATYAGSPVSNTKLDIAQAISFFATDKAGNIETAGTATIPARPKPPSAPTAAVGVAPALALSTRTDCKAGKPVVTVRAKNTASAVTDIRIGTTFGDRRMPEVLPGGTFTSTFKITAGTTVAAGSVAIAASTSVGGIGIESSYAVTYAAIACSG